MTFHRSILTAARARDLFAGLPEDGHVGTVTMTPGGVRPITITARRAWRWEASGWDPLTLHTEQVLTGGVLITGHGPPRTSQMPARTITRRLRPGWTEDAFLRVAERLMHDTITQAFHEETRDLCQQRVEAFLGAAGEPREQRLKQLVTWANEHGLPFEYEHMTMEQIATLEEHIGSRLLEV